MKRASSLNHVNLSLPEINKQSGGFGSDRELQKALEQSVRSFQTFITSQMCVSSFPAGTTQRRLKYKTSLNFCGVLRCVIKVQPESGAVESQHINSCRSKGNYCVLHGGCLCVCVCACVCHFQTTHLRYL